MNCYCGNPLSFDDCCLPIILGEKIAKTPEQLMRSRYSAYAARYSQYIYDTYASQTISAISLDEIAQWTKQTTWLKLTVIASDTVDLNDFNQARQHQPQPSVHFSALYIDDKSFYIMEEKSRFIVENNQWRYLDGDIINHQQLTTPKRNAPCLCQSNKKFKHCCATKF